MSDFLSKPAEKSEELSFLLFILYNLLFFSILVLLFNLFKSLKVGFSHYLWGTKRRVKILIFYVRVSPRAI